MRIFCNIMAVIALIAGGLLLALTAPDYITHQQNGEITFKFYEKEGITTGHIVSGDIDNVVASFSEGYLSKYGFNLSKGKTQDYYIIPIGEQFVAIKVGKEYSNELNAIASDYEKFRNNEITELTKSFKFTGIVEVLPEDVKSQYYNWFLTNNYLGSTDMEVIKAKAKPYAVVYKDYANIKKFMLIGLGFVALSILLFIIQAIIGAAVAKARFHKKQEIDMHRQKSVSIEVEYEKFFSQGGKGNPTPSTKKATNGR